MAGRCATTNPTSSTPGFWRPARMATTGTRCSLMPAERTRPLYLALDQGGHASRALVFDAHGVAQARSLREVQEHHPQADWVEQDPDDLVASRPGGPPRVATQTRVRPR